MLSILREAECAAYLDVKVAVEALDEHDEGARQVVPQGRRIDGLAGVLGPRANQEALRGGEGHIAEASDAGARDS